MTARQPAHEPIYTHLRAIRPDDKDDAHAMSCRKKLIEVALPLEDINREAARENSILHGPPSALHLWRPLEACRAVLPSSPVDGPSERAAQWKACKAVFEPAVASVRRHLPAGSSSAKAVSRVNSLLQVS